MKHWALRAARGTALGILAEIAARGANAIFFIFLARRLESDAGAYTLGFTYALVLIQLSLGGLEQLINREVARKQYPSAMILGNFLLARLASSLLCYGALALWLSGPYGYEAAVNHVVLIVGATFIPDSLTALCQGYLIARDRVGYITLLGGLTGGLKLALGGLVLALGGHALAVAWVLLAISLITLLLYVGLICWRFEWPAISLERTFWSKSLRDELPLLGTAILFTVESSTDAFLLARGSNTVALGVFAAATNVLIPLMVLPQTYRQIILPIMTAWFQTERERAFDIYRQSTRLALIVTLLIATSITLIADQITVILYKDHFGAAAPVLQIVIWTLVFASVLVPNGRLLLVAGRQSVVVPIQFCSLVLNLVLNVLLQPAIGAQGAAIARVASTSLTFLLCLIYVQRTIYRWNVLAAATRPICAAVVLALVAGGLRWAGLHWLLALGAGWLAYAGALFALRGISIGELRGLLDLLRQSRAQAAVK
ncbi:MAG TPA: polysaccharide biosynthesis C-terminal domain-containing protein [Roseiflexaceae bacterium]|nr:polysaccharide biosynthesis C-terminal domain-containing protein [Roseiflexaceae bacterium]